MNAMLTQEKIQTEADLDQAIRDVCVKTVRYISTQWGAHYAGLSDEAVMSLEAQLVPTRMAWEAAACSGNLDATKQAARAYIAAWKQAVVSPKKDI